ncbi:MAG: GNAT family N-acetyltransferase [Candidatus Heimdallarchaeota archaeon]|nr:GNAT family N-acetyltransferase [Candidatus Heimdallarchaeota archaeon]MBY8994304.1 GNAT family N-acetyltransferase [Candidatus Heimdallarchaeota archaeon]
MKISKMTKKHVPQVIDVLREAFNDWSLKNRGRSRNRNRKPEAILPYLEIEPDGCIVAIERSKVVGAIFCHVWGKFGWIGTFGVHPDFQAKGYGKDLMNKAIEYLDKERNVTTLALETMNASNSNIGLYSKLGFKPAFQTIRLIRPIIVTPLKEKNFSKFAEENNLEISFMSQEEEKDDIITRGSWLASKIENGLDYKSEIELADKYKFGEIILLKREGFIIGFAICRLLRRYETEEIDQDLTVKILVIDKDVKDPQYLDYLLFTCDKLGEKLDKKNLKMNINSSYWLVYKHLIESEFQVRSTILRMIKFSEDIKSYDHYHEWLVNCTSFSM